MALLSFLGTQTPSSTGSNIPEASESVTGYPDSKEQTKEERDGTSLVAQWLRFHAPNEGGPGLIPGLGTRSHMHAETKSPHATTKEPASCN